VAAAAELELDNQALRQNVLSLEKSNKELQAKADMAKSGGQLPKGLAGGLPGLGGGGLGGGLPGGLPGLGGAGLPGLGGPPTKSATKKQKKKKR
ncbi:MAG: hypothetical protein AAFR01_13525, partial [Pseudomonadota bacterium]